MEITKTIKIGITIKKGKVVCNSPFDLRLALGTSAVSGNLSFYGVEKKGKQYIVPIDKVRERLSELEDRKQKLEETINIMRQIVKGED